MTLPPRDWTIIPEQTAQIARAAFPKGNIYMKMRDELGVLYSEARFGQYNQRRFQEALYLYKLF